MASEVKAVAPQVGTREARKMMRDLMDTAINLVTVSKEIND
jgi:hypothetical protein